MKKIDDNYQKIISASVEGEYLIVEFANEDVAEASIKDLFKSMRNHDIDDVDVTDNNLINVTFNPRKITWVDIRKLTDPEFSKAQEESAKEEAREKAKKEKEGAIIFGQKIRIFRESKDVSIKEVAAIIGVGPQSLANFERGKGELTFSNLLGLLSALGVTMQEVEEMAAPPSSPETTSAKEKVK
jgi:DNA-binding transcriptional regulator YiaG